jgi:transcriptional regulator with XRE-family HTH domain
MQEKTSQTFAFRLKRCLDRRGLTQAELAKAIKISPGHITDVLKGRKEMGVKGARKAAEYFRVPFVWLYQGEGELPDFLKNGNGGGSYDGLADQPQASRLDDGKPPRKAQQLGIPGVPGPAVDVIRLLAERLPADAVRSVSDHLYSGVRVSGDTEELRMAADIMSFLLRVEPATIPAT